MSTNFADTLRSVARSLEAAKQEINLARRQATKPNHLSMRAKRAAVQAARAVASAVDAGFDDIWPIGWWILWSLRDPNDPARPPATFLMGGKKANLHSITCGSGCNSDGSLSDGTALELWVQFICPVLRSLQTASFKGGAGAFDFPRVKTDETGHLLARTGQPLNRIEIKGPTGRAVGWKLESPPACESDDYDSADCLEHLRCQAADWSDACAVAVEFVSAAAEEPDSMLRRRGKPTGRPATVNERMLSTIQGNQEAMGWSTSQWAKHLRCAKSTVCATVTWKTLAQHREREKAERMKDRRRR